MKTKPFLPLFIILLFSKIQAQDSIKLKTLFPVRKSELFFLVSREIPKGSFGEKFDFDPDEPLENSVPNTLNGTRGGFGAKNGLGGDFGGNFYFTKKPKRIAYGVKLTFFSFASFPFRWQYNGDYLFDEASYWNVDFISVKAGPTIRFMLFKNIGMRLSYQLAPAVGFNNKWVYNKTHTYKGTDYIEKGDLLMNKGYGLDHEFSFQLNYRFIIASICYNFGRISYENIHFDHSAQYTDGVYFYNVSVLMNSNMPVNSLIISLGFLISKKSK